MAATTRHDVPVAFSRDGGTVVVHIAGDVDVASVLAVQQALRSVIEEQGNLFVRIDLGGMTFVDSTGLGVFIEAVERLRDMGGELTLSPVPPFARRLFDIVGLA